MASPQLEQGHARLANELLEALIKCPPATVSARQLWDWVWRESWGRKGAMNTRPTSVRALAEVLHLSRGAAARAVEVLLETNHAVRNSDGSFSIQKDYEQWVRDTRFVRRPPGSKQLVFLDDVAVPRAGTKRPMRGATVAPRMGQKWLHARDKSGPTHGTHTIRNIKKERKKDSIPPDFSEAKDTPRLRALVGDPERPPEEHKDFRALGFKRRDELTEQWKENVAKHRCRKHCGRVKASDVWPYCRPCTVCSSCGAAADGTRKFVSRHGAITCDQCTTENP